MDYLDGLATGNLAGDGTDALKRAQSESKLTAPPPYNAKANTLFFLEFGRGPTKYAAGEYGEQLRFRTGQSAARTAVIKIGSQTLQAGPYDDLNFQATTRGGRVMDHVLANKTVFKTTTDTVGNAALIGGAVTGMSAGRNRAAQDAAIGLLAFGLVSKIVSATTTPAADTRCWDSLPQYLSFVATDLPPGQHTATIEFLDASGKPISALAKTATITVSATRDTVVFISDQSHTTKNL